MAEQLVINANGVRLRAGPTTGAPILAAFGQGTPAQALDDHAWRYVRVAGQTGWVAADLMDVVAIDSGGGRQPDDDTERQFSLDELLPALQSAQERWGFDYQWVAGVAYQESGFRNFRVHRDGTGHGLFGLDDNGLLPSFEKWSGLSIGRGPTANIIPMVQQIEYATMALQDYASRLGGKREAVAAWHRGEGLYRDARGQAYADLTEAHVSDLFGVG